jgi:hypothetical protein
MRDRSLVARPWLIFLALLWVLLGISAARAAVFNPLPATADGAPGSLRDVITQANSNGQSDTINLAAGTYSLTVPSATQDNANAGGDLDIAADGGSTLTIVGAGKTSTTIRWPLAGQDRILHLQEGATVILRDLAVENGQAFDDGTPGAPPEETDGVGGLVLLFDASLTAENVTFSSGTVVARWAKDGSGLEAQGGAISVENGSLTLTNSEVFGSLAQGGPGVEGGQPSGSARGGGIYCADSNLLLESVTVALNAANSDVGSAGADNVGSPGGVGGNGGDGLGGGLYAAGCAVIVQLSSFWDNSTNGGAGAPGGDGTSGGDGGDGGVANGGSVYIQSTNTPVQLIDSTFSGGFVRGGQGGIGGAGGSLAGGNGGDSPGGEGGALYAAGDVALVNSTIAASTTESNTPGAGGPGSPPGSAGAAGVSAYGGIRVTGTVSGESTISADNSSADGFSGGALDSSLFELVPSGIALGTNQFGVDPGLQPLADNGGPTRTHAILPGSAAQDEGSNSTGLLTDQRGAGFPRTVGAGTDVGAFEIQGGPQVTEVPTLSGWALMALAAALSALAWMALRRS